MEVDKYTERLTNKDEYIEVDTYKTKRYRGIHMEVDKR